MNLAAGTRLGPYEITAVVGAGGMGEVYRARDTRLDRTVAIKVLPAEVAADLERRDRFEREARAVAALNHPNVCVLHDVGREGDLDFIVMEFVEGETLADRVHRGPLSMAEARPIALQIADALDAAHEKGIVHRDLKPANVRITPDGVVKVLDFGLAKALDPVGSGAAGSIDASNSPTYAAGSTRFGIILGTAAYMSPEQARGQRVDRRTDIWAFGCLVYEMLAGRQAFGGETVTDALAAIVEHEPDWSLLPGDVPHAVRRMLARCLQKDVKHRLRDIGDARLDLEDTQEPVPAIPGSIANAAARSSWSPRAAGLLVASIAVALAAGLVAGRSWERGQTAPIEWQGELLGGSTVAMGPRISPDGQMLAFTAMVDNQNQVAVMKPQSGNWTILSRDRTRGLVNDVSWSRDGNRIFFDRFSEVPRGVFSIPPLGGDERLVLEDAGFPRPLADGSLLVTRINTQRTLQLFHFWPDSGRLEALDAFLNPDPSFRVFPDGREAVFIGTTSNAPTVPAVYAIELGSGRTRRLAPLESVANRTPLAVTPNGRSVLAALPSGNAFRVVQVPRDGSGAVRSLFTLTNRPAALDVGPDGSVYVDQSERIPEVVWYAPSLARIERRALPGTATTSDGMVLPLPDGRVLFPSAPAGRDQLAVMAPGRDPVPFLETEEPTNGPTTLLGKDQVAFRIGAPPNERIAVASLVDGRILRRLPRPAANITGLAGSPDGATLFYVEAGVIWAMSSEGGEPRKVHEGNRVAVDPNGPSLIVQVTARDAVRLVRVPIAGGKEEPISRSGDLRLIESLSPSAVAPDGRIAVRVVSNDNWFWPAAILDPRTGAITQLPRGVQDLDMPGPAWTSDGRLVSLALPWKSAIWRFRPIGGEP